MGIARTNRTTQRARALFLLELEKRGNITDACKAASITRRQTVYEWKAADQEFSDAWDAALDKAMDEAEAAAYRRGVEGWDEPVFGSLGNFCDGQVGTIHKYSDTMLTLVLKANRPDKFREKIDHEHRGTVNVEFVNNWREEADN